jgi:hypothetical protein|tara:strand:+ start:1714 stop:1983 length:270 start_codon:yes stop_codon:yes gene_type:complete
MKYEAKKKEIKKFKAQSDQFYLTSSTLKREPTQQAIHGNQILEDVKYQKRKESVGPISRHNITLEKNLFSKKFPGSQTVKNTIKMRTSP